MAVTYTVAVERNERRAHHWTDRIGLSALTVAATSCVAMLAIGLAYAGRTNVFESAGRTVTAPLNLNTVTDAGPLEAAMETVFSDASDRRLAAERLFRFYASATEDINVSVSYTDRSGATKTIILQAGLPVYLEASRFQLGLSRLGQQGPEVTVRGNFGPCW